MEMLSQTDMTCILTILYNIHYRNTKLDV